MIIQIPDLFSPHEVRAMREQLDQADWADGRATAGHRAIRVKDNQQLPLDDPAARHLANTVLERLGQSPTFIAAALPRRILQPRFSRYDGHGHYGNHVDNALFPVPGTGDYVRSDVSSTLFLSDPGEYDGGELMIEDTFGTQTVKLPAGHLVVYPSSSLHRVAPVTRGQRHVAFFWTQSFVASAEQRRMLFELDGAIQALGADHPDHASVDRLSHVYHNLLRQWSHP